MITVNGTVSFLLQEALPFTVSYSATVNADCQVIELFDTIEDAPCDIYKHDLEWKYLNAMHAAVRLDIDRQLEYING